jgi:hypothetical protein
MHAVCLHATQFEILCHASRSIGAVLEKQRISSLIASIVLKPFGNKPENVLLGIMSLGMFLSVSVFLTDL